MDDLITRFLRGEARPGEIAQLAAWRQAASENEQHFRSMAAVWRATAPDHAPRPTAASIIRQAEGRRPSFSVRRMATLAAMLVLGLAIGEFRPGARSQLMLSMTELVTGATEMATTRLSDGTVVRLAPASRLQVVESAKRREVWLDGKAFFAVEASERDPFVVRTRAGEAQVLGTRFQVEVKDEDFRVIVVEGRVDVGAGGARVSVGGGQAAYSSAGVPPSVVETPNVAGLVDWMGAVLIFESTPLYRVAQEVERRFDIQVSIADPALRNRTITAWFGEEEVEPVLSVICRIADVRCVIDRDVVTIAP